MFVNTIINQNKREYEKITYPLICNLRNDYGKLW